MQQVKNSLVFTALLATSATGACELSLAELQELGCVSTTPGIFEAKIVKSIAEVDLEQGILKAKSLVASGILATLKTTKSLEDSGVLVVQHCVDKTKNMGLTLKEMAQEKIAQMRSTKEKTTTTDTK